jgi:ADP-heptose:LPS heptosyltransferase
MFWLGVPEAEIPRAKMCGHAPERAPYVVIHPFASAPEKAWSLPGFLAFAEAQKKAGLDPVIVAGSGDDVAPFDGFEILRGASLCEVKNLMAGATLFLGNDSGPAHIAAAFGVPVIVLFGPSDPVAWAPWKTESQVLQADPLINIKVDQVLAAADALRVKA